MDRKALPHNDILATEDAGPVRVLNFYLKKDILPAPLRPFYQRMLNQSNMGIEKTYDFQFREDVDNILADLKEGSYFSQKGFTFFKPMDEKNLDMKGDGIKYFWKLRHTTMRKGGNWRSGPERITVNRGEIPFPHGSLFQLHKISSHYYGDRLAAIIYEIEFMGRVGKDPQVRYNLEMIKLGTFIRHLNAGYVILNPVISSSKNDINSLTKALSDVERKTIDVMSNPYFSDILSFPLEVLTAVKVDYDKPLTLISKRNGADRKEINPDELWNTNFANHYFFQEKDGRLDQLPVESLDFSFDGSYLSKKNVALSNEKDEDILYI